MTLREYLLRLRLRLLLRVAVLLLLLLPAADAAGVELRPSVDEDSVILASPIEDLFDRVVILLLLFSVSRQDLG